jgi:hypothetical protein
MKMGPNDAFRVISAIGMSFNIVDVFLLLNDIYRYY